MRTSQHGELLFPATFVCDLNRCRCLSPHCLAVSPPRGTSMPPPLWSTTRAPEIRFFRGSITRPQCSLSTLRSPPHDGPRKTRLQPVANLCCAGLVTRRVTFEVSTHVSSSAKLAWRNDHQSMSCRRDK